MTAAGIEAPPDQIVADGKLHRFASSPGRKSSTGWYIVHHDPVAPVWLFGDWRLGIKQRDEGDPGRALDPAEIAERKERLREMRAKIAAEEVRFQAGAAIEGRQRWDRCPPASAEHAYLRTKRIDPCGARVDGDNLLVPMRDIDGKIWSLQEIAADGRKHNQEGGRRKGCFFQIGEVGDTLCIGEGFSTCATLHMATGYAAFSAGDAGNIENVASVLREKYPAATIIVCADDDWLTRVNGKPKNVGKIAGQKAAKAIGAALALPWFGSARPKWATDFNDQARLSGLDDVADGVKLALVEHQESLERLRAEEPPPSTPEDFGRSSADDSVMLSEDALALRFAETNGDTLRFVAVWPRWFEWATNRWRADEKLHAMSLARETCRQAAG
jgi:putative DNA primase/helicase